MQQRMQEAESGSTCGQPRVVPFCEFLEALTQALDREGLRSCVLRNYEGFPTDNFGNDVDFLIAQSDLPRAMRALRSIESVRIVGYAEHPHVASVFLAGTTATPGCRSLQIDFYGILGRKGLPYLPVDAVLRAAIGRRAGNVSFLVPSPVHEAIISLLTSLVVSAWLKEKYFPQVQRTFISHKLEVIAALTPQFGAKATAQLVGAVIDGDRRKVQDCVGPLRTAQSIRSLLRRPLRSFAAIARHYAMEFSILYLPKGLETVRIVGMAGCGKTELIESLFPILQSSAKVVEERPARMRLPLGQALDGVAASGNFHAEVRVGWFASMSSAVLWQAGEWLSQFIRKKNLLLRICEGCYQDLVIDPKKYRYAGPEWFAQLVGRLSPRFDLWILLDAPAEVLRSRSPQIPPDEILRQREAYRAFVMTRKRYVILDASRPAPIVMEEAYGAIIDTLADRVDRTLRSRF